MNRHFIERIPCASRMRASFFATIVAWLALCFAIISPSPARAQGTWQSMPTPFFSGHAMLLTDGTVVVQDFTAGDWWKLIPDQTGSYTNGTWTQIATMPVINGEQYAPLYYASAVLADGRMVVLGGEYNLGFDEETNSAAIYDPVADAWAPLAGPAGWDLIGDAGSSVLPNGQFFMQQIADNNFNASTTAAILDPISLTWTIANTNGKADGNNEEGYALLPNGNLLTVDTSTGMNSEIYNTLRGGWTTAGSTIVELSDVAGDEIGPMVLRPDGTVICFGGIGHNALYNSITGVWTAMPDFPTGLDCADAPACLLPSGNVLVCASPGLYNNGLEFFEFDGTKLNPVPNIAGPSDPNQMTSFQCNMLMLPTGQVLMCDFNQEVQIYTPAGSPNPAWAPNIVISPVKVITGKTYTLVGTQFNGLSQDAMYGDDAQSATNYPMVRVTSTLTGDVNYYRTHDHSTMAVATGNQMVSTMFDVPATAESGPAEIQVVTNGIPSAPRAIVVNPGPAAIPQTLNIPLGTPTPIQLIGIDTAVPPPTLTFALASAPTNGTLTGFDAETGKVTYTPNINFQGTDDFTFTVSGGGLTSQAAKVTLIVAPAIPTANSQTVHVNLGVSTQITLTGSDPDTPALSLTFTLTSSPSHGTLTPLNDGTGVLRYIPNIGFSGTDSFNFVDFNGYNESKEATVTLNVSTDTPNANSQTVSVPLNTATSITLSGTDPELPPLPLTFAIATQPANGTLSGLNTSTGAVTYTPNNGYFGADSFTFTVNNGTATSAPATVSLQVGPQAPTANAQAVSVAHNSARAITLTGTDPNNPPLSLTFGLGTAPANGTLTGFNASTGAVTYTPNTNFHGADSFTFTVNNGYETSALAAVTLSVAPGTPTANSQTINVTSSAPIVVTLTGSDPESPPIALTFAIASEPAIGTLSGLNASTGAVTYTPKSGFSGTDSFTFTVSNGTNTSAPATVTLVAPVAVTSLVLSPTTVAGGASSTGTVTLNEAAPTGGTVVSLSSSSGSAAPPASVTVASGSSTAQFTITTTAVSSSTSAIITAAVGASKSTATLTITPVALVSLSVSPAGVVGGSTSTGTVTLNGPAGTGGAVVGLSSSAGASVPGSVTVPAGQSSATFTIGTNVTSTQINALITATLGASVQKANLTITPPVIIAVTLNPTSVKGGKSSTGTVTIGTAAPAAGIVVNLSSKSSSAGVPASVKIASGKTSATFTVTTKTVSVQTSALILAVLGQSAKTATLTITH